MFQRRSEGLVTGFKLLVYSRREVACPIWNGPIGATESEICCFWLAYVFFRRDDKVVYLRCKNVSGTRDRGEDFQWILSIAITGCV